MFRTPLGIVTVTTTFRSVGPEELVPNIGVDLPDPRVPRFGSEAGAEEVAPGNADDRIKRISKSAPVGPSDFDTSIDTGSWRFVFDHDFKSGEEGMRFTS